jgi:CMP-N,N'-diacetyllegionaminic acid synthase
VKILTLIPARGGSKRLPGKNIKLLGGKPLITWTINVAKGIPEICDILVSTNDTATAKIARNEGALVPWLRPEELATDTASSVDVCLHALTWYEAEKGKVDGLLLLQPTSPFRTRNTVLRGIQCFHDQNRTVIGFSPAKSHPMLCFKFEGKTFSPFIEGIPAHIRSQDLPPAYVVNGSFYLITPADLRNKKSFLSDDIIPLLPHKPTEDIDIDTEIDWIIAEAIMASQQLSDNDSH